MAVSLANSYLLSNVIQVIAITAVHCRAVEYRLIKIYDNTAIAKRWQIRITAVNNYN